MTEHRPKPNSKLRGQNKSRGQGLVEFSLILPILLFLILGIIDYGRILLVFANSSTAIRDAARNATLLSADAASGLPRYVACDRIYNTADDILFASDIEVNVVYFNTPNDPDLGANPTQLSDIAAAMAAVNPDNAGNRDFSGADFDCPPPATYANTSQMSSANGITDVSEDVVGTGDIMVVTLDAEIEFITPILASLFPTIELNFRTQRTVITRLLLTPTGLDRDFDGLLDSYELAWFGCMLADYETVNRGTDPVIIRPNDWLYSYDESAADVFAIDTFDSSVDPYTYTTTNAPYPQDNADASPTTNANAEYDNVLRPPNNSSTYNGDCATEDLIYDASVGQGDYALLGCNVSTWPPADNVVPDCIVPNTVEFTATSDPDGDGCNNGCESARGTNTPIFLGGYNSPDTDGDGLLDGFEIGIGTDPTVADSDGDGLWDGQEVCPEGYTDPSPAPPNPITGGCDPDLRSDPNEPDSDFDNILDIDEVFGNNSGGFVTDPNDSDSDDDGISDSIEINGGTIVIPNIDGIANISFTVAAGVLDPTPGSDSDGDGITDRVEYFEGYLISNQIDGVDIRVFSNPASADTDGDGVSDGLGTGNGPTDGGQVYASANPVSTGSLQGGVQDVNPIKSDTDDDGLNDGLEQLTYLTIADNPNSDGLTLGGNGNEGNCEANGVPQAPLDDGFEILGFVDLYGAGNDTNIDGDFIQPAGTVPLNNALDGDSDGDGLTDCEEFYFYSTNPYNPNSDGDGYTDDQEITAENFCLNPLVDDGPSVANPCGSGTDADADGIDDAWELEATDLADDGLLNGTGDLTTIVGDGTDSYLTEDYDNDLCDNACELARNTNPLDPDSDDDYIRDGVEIGSNPNNSDTDGDGIIDGYEACSDLAWSGWSVPPTGTCVGTDVIDADTDDDGYEDGDELDHLDSGGNPDPTDPLDPDSDDDGLLDGQEIFGINVVNALSYVTVNTAPTVTVRRGTWNGGTNSYTVSNDSLVLNTVTSDPTSADTDGDGISDGDEVYLQFLNPNNPDTDGDGINDGTTSSTRGELSTSAGTGWGDLLDPRNFDTDQDGLSDGDEILGHRFNPSILNSRTLPGYDPDTSEGCNASNTFDVAVYSGNEGFYSGIGGSYSFLVPWMDDSDNDGSTDLTELTGPANQLTGPATSNPTLQDTDCDSFGNPTRFDGAEITDGTNPRDSNDPGGIPDADIDGDGLVDADETAVSITYQVDGSTNPPSFSGDIALSTSTTVDSDNYLGYEMGYDSDYDGLSDGFESYIHDLGNTSNFIAGFDTSTGWTNSSGECAYYTNNSTTSPFPLDGTQPDTDRDGIGDGYECNVSLTDPFTTNTTVTGQIDTANNLLDSATTATLDTRISTYTTVYNDLTSGGFTFDAEGRVLLGVTRRDGTTRLIDSLVTDAALCGPAWNGSAMESPEPCGILESYPESNTAGTSDDTINIWIAPSSIVALLALDEAGADDILSVQLPVPDLTARITSITPRRNDDPGGNNTWNIEVEFQVQDENGDPVLGADVSIPFTLSGNGSGSLVNNGPLICTTDASGNCTTQGTTIYPSNGNPRVDRITLGTPTITNMPTGFLVDNGLNASPSPAFCDDDNSSCP